jgi:hypothetical protein
LVGWEGFLADWEGFLVDWEGFLADWEGFLVDWEEGGALGRTDCGRGGMLEVWIGWSRAGNDQINFERSAFIWLSHIMYMSHDVTLHHSKAAISIFLHQILSIFGKSSNFALQKIWHLSSI